MTSIPPLDKARLALRILTLAVQVHIATRRHPLPAVVTALAAKPPMRRFGLGPVRLGGVVRRTLTIAGRPPRCLIAALVAFRLSRDEGHPVELVIGLPKNPTDKDAHAWLEIDGRDVGPPPGRLEHVELARYR